MLLTANGVSFNWNKHNVMERVRWLPLCLRGGMASRFLHGWRVREGGGDAKVQRKQIETERRKNKTKRRFYCTSSLQIKADTKTCTFLCRERVMGYCRIFNSLQQCQTAFTPYVHRK